MSRPPPSRKGASDRVRENRTNPDILGAAQGAAGDAPEGPPADAEAELDAEVDAPAAADSDDSDDAWGGLSPAHARAIDALLAQPSYAAAASAAGVSERTLRRWAQRPAFRSAWYAARRDAFGHAIGLTQKYAPVAVAALVKVAQDAASPPAAKVSAASALLRFGREGVELDDLAARVEALEQGAGPPPPAGGPTRLRLTGEEA